MWSTAPDSGQNWGKSLKPISIDKYKKEGRLKFYKITGVFAAYRTDKIIRQGVGLQNIAAYSAAVAHNLFGFLLIGGSIGRRSAVFLQVIIGVGQRLGASSITSASTTSPIIRT